MDNYRQSNVFIRRLLDSVSASSNSLNGFISAGLASCVTLERLELGIN